MEKFINLFAFVKKKGFVFFHVDEKQQQMFSVSFVIGIDQRLELENGNSFSAFGQTVRKRDQHRFAFRLVNWVTSNPLADTAMLNNSNEKKMHGI